MFEAMSVDEHAQNRAALLLVVALGSRLGCLAGML
jgi:hypothetical protein